MKFDSEFNAEIYPFKSTDNDIVSYKVPAYLLLGYKESDKTGLEGYIRTNGMYNGFNDSNTLSNKIFLKYVTPFELLNGLKLKGYVSYSPYSRTTYYKDSVLITLPYHSIEVGAGTIYNKDKIFNETTLYINVLTNRQSD